MPSNDSPTTSATGAKKGKKKTNKKKSKKPKAEVRQQAEEDDDNDYESLSDSSEKADDDEEEVFPGATVASTQGPSESAKLAATMIYNYESTQLEDQIHVMIRQLAEECKVDKSVVSDVVNRMFESGLQYDDHDEVLKYLKPKAASGEKSTPAKSATAPPSTVQSGRNAKAASAPAPVAASSLDVDAQAALARFNSAGGGLNHHHHHTRSEHHGPDAKHGREIEPLHTEPVSVAPQLAVKVPVQVAMNVAAPVVAAPAAAPAAISAPQQALSSMKEKLDFVAAYSRTNLYDSLAALCSWASVSMPGDASAASEKEQKMEAFFQSQALEILLSTLFSDDSQQMSRAEVKGAFQALLQHVLLLQADPQGTSSVHQITESLAQLVAQVYALRGAKVVPAFASSSARGNQVIAQQVAACVRKLYTQLSFNSSTGVKSAVSASEDGNEDILGKIAAIDAQLQGLEKAGAKKGASAAEAAQEKVQNMFLSREVHADKVQLCVESVKKLNTKPKLTSAAVQRPAPVASASAADLNKSVSESSSLIEHILLTEFDHAAGSGALSPVSASSLQSKHQHSHHINSTFERAIYERDSKLATLNSELGASNLRLQELTAHKQRLLEQVRLCEQEIANVGARSNTLTTELGNTTYFYQQQLDQLVQTGNTVRKSLQAHDQVNSLISAVRAFETKFAEALLYQHAVAHASAPHTSFAASNGAGVARNTTVITSSAAGMQVKNSAGVTTSTAAPGRVSAEESNKAELAERLQVLAGSLHSYVAAEAQCIQFLAQRVVDAQVKQAAARKELLAYAALMMKGQVVVTAEATVSQLDAEISEDQQGVRQLQQNVADSLAQIRALDGSSGRSGGKATILYPASELALIVQSCTSVGVSPAADIVLLAGKAPVPAPLVPNPPPVVAAAPVVAPAAAARAPRAEKTVAGKETRGVAGAKTERDGSRRDREKGGNKRNDAQKSEVDTVSAIQQLERSCLQKPSTGSAAPAKVAAAPLSTRTGPAPRTAAPAGPVHSVWKIPAAATSSSSSDGIHESKSDAVEGAKSLKEIQAEQQNEKMRLLQQKHQRAAASVAAVAAVAAGPTPAQATTAVNEEPAVEPALVVVPVESVVESVAEKIEEVEEVEEVVASVENTPAKDKKKKAKSTPKKEAPAVEDAIEPSADTTNTAAAGVDEETAAVKTESAVFEALPKRSPKKKSKAAPAASEPAEAVETAAEETVIAEEAVVAESTIETIETVETTEIEQVMVVEEAVGVVEPVAEVTEEPAVEEVVVTEASPVEVTPQKVPKQCTPVEDSADTEPTELDLVEQAREEEEASTESKERTPGHNSSHTAAEESVDVTPVKQQTLSASEGHSTPLPNIAADLSAEGSSAAITPTADARPHADSFTSPLVEFHHAYKIKEIGLPVLENEEEGAVNPMKGPTSPVVSYSNTYPELEEECDLLIEMETEDVGQSSDEEEDEGLNADTASDAGDLGYSFNAAMMSSASNSVTSKSSASKMRDINPMARPSPGKGSRVRLDIAHVTENDSPDCADGADSAVAPLDAQDEEKNSEAVGVIDRTEVTEIIKIAVPSLAECCAEEEQVKVVVEEVAVEEEVVEKVKVEEEVEVEVVEEVKKEEVETAEVVPVVKAPVVEAPVVEPPVVEAPVVEAPVVEAPVVEAPVEKVVSDAKDSEFAPTFKSKRFAVFSANQVPAQVCADDAVVSKTDANNANLGLVDDEGHTVKSKRFAVYSGNAAV